MDDLLQLATRLAEHDDTPLTLPIPGRVAYVVSHGQSYASNGYAIRTQGIAQALNAQGCEVLCLVRPGRPWELNEQADVTTEVTIDGVRYLHSRWPAGKVPKGECAHLEASVERFTELFRVYRPEKIIAASNYIVGLPAWIAAKRLGLPFDNEVRGFWELSREAREPGYAKTQACRQEAERDAFVARKAGHVFTLNHAMREELARRDVNPTRISIVPNGVSQLPALKSGDDKLRKKLGIDKDCIIIGYIGSFTAYEGLDVLTKACADLVKAGEKIQLLLVGDDQPLTQAVESIKTVASIPWLIRAGRVPHEQIADYYSLFDAVVIPRKNSTVCQLVPPMKAAEALAFGKRLVVSDVAPLVEYAQNFESVITFEAGSSQSLVKALQGALKLPVPQPSTELLFSAHIEPMVRVLKGEKGQQGGESEAVAKQVVAPVINSKSELPSQPVQKLKDKIELSNSTYWREIEVSQGQSITVKGNVQYHNKKGIVDRKAVMLVKACGQDGRELDVACGALAKSQPLGAYYKYLHCSQGAVVPLHEFEVPDEVVKIKVGFRLFHARSVKVTVDGLEIGVKKKISSLVHKASYPDSAAFADLSKVLRENVPPPKVSKKESDNNYNVLTIMDEFTQDCFKDEFNLVPADKAAWREQLDNDDFDMFFAESAWRGNGATWNYCMSKIKGKFGSPLLELLLECKRRKIPTVFWNKEDPVNYDVFIDAASCFDYIFTTDATVIDRYKEDVGHDRVYLLKFAAQEKLHSPLLKGEKNGRVAFAGSWNGEKYPTRAERLEMLFEYPLEKGILDIYDRYSSLENAAPGLVYPEKYKASLLPAVPYNKIADQVYKKYSVMINVNSVEDSSSMLARRIYELCGCGTPIVSSPANSLKNELSEIVQVANTPQESREKISRVLDDDVHALKIAAKGVRFVHSANTYRHRFSEILDKVAEGRDDEGVERFRVTAVCVSKRPWFAANVARMLKAQNGVEVKVIYVAHGEETDESEVVAAFQEFESFKFMRISGEDKVLADGLNLALDACDTDIVAKIDDDDHYGPNYLLDSCLALQYSGAALVGKTSFFCYVESTNDFALRFPGKHYRYFKRVQGGTLVWSRKMTGNLKFTQVRQGTDSIFIKDLLDSGRKVFSADPFNFVHVRYSSGNNHTWAIDDAKFLEAAKKLGSGLMLDIAFN
ncbi:MULTISPECIES: glycosyltransferase [unclassified Cobetia]|uniref:glycosyltransferase n=1 Tax=unclassified Cobetia TaxID=2609414 RepID=UPI002097758B|nr:MULTISPECIES: glycosyltransferase [unclassified Cobetia]MCO7233454.1 glycosyltransferase [Cobetia sp. Dlab-2-AX]MCO7236729.1 glycosyltransferase [Cobetia sp. Dlab-2-U]